MLVTRIYLELGTPADFRPPSEPPSGFSAARVAAPTSALYRELYSAVGASYHWRDRLSWSDADLAAHLARPEIGVYTAMLDGAIVGWYELRDVGDGSVEIAYFGLIPQAVGRGLGKQLLAVAVRDAWSRGARRVWLHTCTLDHPHALPNYRARGFREFHVERYDTETV